MRELSKNQDIFLHLLSLLSPFVCAVCVVCLYVQVHRLSGLDEPIKCVYKLGRESCHLIRSVALWNSKPFATYVPHPMSPCNIPFLL